MSAQPTTPTDGPRRQLVFDRLAALLERECAEAIGARRVVWTTHLRDDLCIESPDFVGLMIVLEEEFGAQIEDRDVSGIETIADLVDLVIETTTLAAPAAGRPKQEDSGWT